MAAHDMANRQFSGVGQSAASSSTASEPAPPTRDSDVPILPAADIFEDAQQITVQAEMPGVSREGLTLQADRNSLVIEGRIGLDIPAGMSAVHADLRTTRYRRSFTLSGELDTEHIAASLQNGLLTVRIPKRVEYRTRKIKVDVG